MSSITEFAAPPGRSAVLDEAHIGHINGALGTIGHGDIAPWTAWVAKMTNAVRRPANGGAMPSFSPRRGLANHRNRCHANGRCRGTCKAPDAILGRNCVIAGDRKHSDRLKCRAL